MARKFISYCVLFACALALTGCGFFPGGAERPAWRDAANKACRKANAIRVSQHVTPRSGIDGPGICGLEEAYYVTALAGGTVSVKSRATLNCPMIAALDKWVAESVQPAAMQRFGARVVEINTMGSYACRRRNHRPGAKLSEHAFANALDIGAFTLSDGRKLKIVQHWRRGEQQERAFLRETHSGACRYFRTVLGPGSDRSHEDHLHLDLAIHGKTSRGYRHYCRPVIKDILPPPRRDNLPDAPYLEPDPEIARRMAPNRALAALPRPGGNPPGQRVRSIPLPRADVPGYTRQSIDERTYGRLRAPDASAPMVLNPMPQGALVGRGTIRADGVYVPPGH